MATKAPAPKAPPAVNGKGLAGLSTEGLASKIEDLWESFSNVKYGRKDPASRAFTFGSQFTVGTMAINVAQFLGAPLALINEEWHNDWIKFNKQQWGLLITTMTHWWSPTLVRVSGDKSVRGQISKSEDGQLVCNFAERMVLIANHQIYTDWLYLWYIGYANGLHGQIHVVMKESLKKLPLVGWGMSLSKFIFLKRNWEQDKAGLAKHLDSLNKTDDPMWLMFFPEGTNLAPSTREKSKAWADKNDIKDLRHVLLPRSTGLQFSLLQLRETVDYVYDCTIAYEGVPRGQYAQDIFTLQTAWVGGHPPKSVNMHWRRFKIAAIPLDDLKAFDLWLRARWAEKDALMEHYMCTGRFPADEGFDSLGPRGQLRQGAGHIETQVKPNNWYEILQVFAPIATIVMVLYYFYNQALPTEFLTKDGDWAGYSEDDIKKLLRVGNAPKLGKPKGISSQALKQTLQPPELPRSQSSTVKSMKNTPSTRRSSFQTSTIRSKAGSIYGGSVKTSIDRGSQAPTARISQSPGKLASSQHTESKLAVTAKPTTNNATTEPKKSTVPKKLGPKRESASTKPPPSKVQDPAPLKQKNKSIESATVQPSGVKPTPKPQPQKNLGSLAGAAKPKSKALDKQNASTGVPATKTKPITSAKKVPVPIEQDKKTKPKAVAPLSEKHSEPLKKPQAVNKTQVARNPNTPVQTPTAKATKDQKPQTIPATTKPSIAKPQLKPTTKVQAGKESTKKAPPVSKVEPQHPDIQTKQGAWSDTTAVNDPWSERPSGKRLVKAQPTRKDRIKMEKKQQRSHLDHLTS